MLGAATPLTPFNHLTGRPPTLHQGRATGAGPLPHLAPKFKDLSASELTIRAFDAPAAPLKNSMMADVMEYGRMVHAEMNAITDAARSRKSTQDSILYCTTMPCHLCTKLVIASGISRVIYIQPYPKSLVDELYGDSVSIDNPGERNKVSFETLKGVTPNGFRIAFRKTKKRKDSNGTAIEWNPLNSSPVFLSYFAYYRDLEIANETNLKKALDNVKDLNLSKTQLTPNFSASSKPKLQT